MPDEDHADDNSLEKRRLAEETRNERKVWYFLAYFLFGIHIVAFVMIYAVTHAPNR
jgi:nitrate reductase NapE component